MFSRPINFKQAIEALNKRKQTPTTLKSKELAILWSDEARAKAFFSARVANASILSELQRRAQQIVEGKMTDSQARRLLRDYFVGEGAKPLEMLGFAPKTEAAGVAELASTYRLELIFQTNARMAQEVGQYQQWNEVKKTYQYGIWRIGYSKVHRPEHVARDGKAYAFDHPIWTESPPGGEFNCHCYRMLARESDLKEQGIIPQKNDSEFEKSSLGFDPSRNIDDPPEFGKRTEKQYKLKAEKQIKEYQEQRKKSVVEKINEPITLYGSESEKNEASTIRSNIGKQLLSEGNTIIAQAIKEAKEKHTEQKVMQSIKKLGSEKQFTDDVISDILMESSATWWIAEKDNILTILRSKALLKILATL